MSWFPGPENWGQQDEADRKGDEIEDYGSMDPQQFNDLLDVEDTIHNGAVTSFSATKPPLSAIGAGGLVVIGLF